MQSAEEVLKPLVAEFGGGAGMIQTRLDNKGVLLATIDMPGRAMNVFSAELMDELDVLMTRVESDPAIQCVVLTSGKATFLAGADLVMVRGFTDQAKTMSGDDLFELCGRLGRQFVRLESSEKPWVAAVNGIALGGGLELAMACRARICADSPKIQLGLPEVRWGLLPGAGGTQRLPRLAGFEAGLELLLSGRSMEPEEAVARRVFDAAVPLDQLIGAAHELALSLCAQTYDPEKKFPRYALADAPPHSPAQARELARRHGVGDETYLNYPAYGVIVDCVLMGARQSLAQATATEMWQFLRLMVDPVAGQMVRTLFLNRQRADRAMAAPKGLGLEGVRHAALNAELQPWTKALGKGRLTVSQSEALSPGQIELVLATGEVRKVQIGVLACPPAPSSVDGQALLTDEGSYGSVMEIHSDDDICANALAALASRVGAMPYRLPGKESPLEVLASQEVTSAAGIDTQSLKALALWDDGVIDNVEWADVAACVSGITPAYCGGPFANLWARRGLLLPTLSATERSAWSRLEPTLKGAFA